MTPSVNDIHGSTNFDHTENNNITLASSQNPYFDPKMSIRMKNRQTIKRKDTNIDK